MIDFALIVFTIAFAPVLIWDLFRKEPPREMSAKDAPLGVLLLATLVGGGR